MNALYIRDIPADVEGAKSRDPRTFRVMGAAVYCWEVFNALLRFSTYERFLLPDHQEGRGDGFIEGPLYAKYRNRITFLGDHELSAFSGFHRVVIFQNRADLHVGARLRRLSGCWRVPVTGVIHSLNYRYHVSNILRILASSLQSYDAMICSSQSGREVLLNYITLVKQRMISTGAQGFEASFETPVIPLGIYTEDFVAPRDHAVRTSLGLDDDAPVLLYVGRFAAHSKADLVPLLITFSQLLSSGEKTWLLLAGDDYRLTDTESLREAATRLGCQSRLRLIPNPSRTTKRALYRAADIFVAISDNLQETFGISLIEAMAAGLPIVAADWDGYRSIVVEDETGYLVTTTIPIYPPGFDALHQSTNNSELLAATTTVSVPGLFAALQRLLKNKHKRIQMGMAGQERARLLYDWKVIVRRYESLWSDLSLKAENATGVSLMPVADLEDYDYRSVFGHYGSSRITIDTVVTITDIGQQCVEKPGMLTVYCGASEALVDSMSIFGVAEMRAVLARLAAIKQASIKDLVSRQTNGTDTDGTLTMLLVCRLAKYGLVRSIS